MPDLKISAMTTANALTAADVVPVVQGGANRKGLMSQIATYVMGAITAVAGATYVMRTGAPKRVFLWPGYISGNWYPPDTGLTFGNGTGTANFIAFVPVVLYEDVTITDLAAVVTTAVASSNFQLAIYACSAAGQPTGSALGSTASMSGATATQVSGPLSGGALTLPAGIYWGAINTDAAIGCLTMTLTQGYAMGYFGSSTLAFAANTNSGRYFKRLAQTFGTWPDVTGATFAEGNSNTFGAVVHFKVA